MDTVATTTSAPERAPGAESTRELRVRVVRRREHHLRAVATTTTGLVGLYVLLFNDLARGVLPLRPDDVSGIAAVTFFMALVALGPWLGGHARPEPMTARLYRDGVYLQPDLFLQRAITFLSVARGAHGLSVGWRRKGDRRITFAEVDDVADAEAIARALGATSLPPARRPSDDLPSRFAWWAQAGVSVLLTFGAILWCLGVAISIVEMKNTFAVSALVLAPIATVVRVARSVVRRRKPVSAAAVSEGTPATAYDEHLALHARAAEAAEAAEAEKDDATRAPASLLRRGASTQAWLARVDALPLERSAYRGDALTREALRATVEDEGAPPDARAAAARVLARRYDEPPEVLARVVADPDVRARVAIVATEEDVEDAAEELDRLGPVFRAR